MNRARCFHRRQGFSLIELLIVIAAIGILIALLAPAVQRIREMASQTECTNNLKQLGIAARNFESVRGHLPPGYIGPMNNKSFNAAKAYGHPEDSPWIGQFPLLLPYLEQTSLAQLVQTDMETSSQSPPWWEPWPTPSGPLPANFTAAVKSLPFFLCPSSNNTDIPFQAASDTAGTVVGFHFYHTGPFMKKNHFLMNYDDATGNPFAWQLGRTNYVGVGGTGRGTSSWWIAWEGIFTNRSRTKLTGIVDGTSNTLAYGEAAGTGNVDPLTLQFVERTLNLSWLGVGAISSSHGIGRAKTAYWDQFSSYHIKGVPFCFADGSVRVLSYALDNPTFLQLSGMRDSIITPVEE